jgi:hypothetical protein
MCLNVVDTRRTVKPKFSASVTQKDGKYFVYVSTPLGETNVEEPTTFQPDIEDYIGPYDSEEEAKKQLVKTEAQLRSKGQLLGAVKHKKAPMRFKTVKAPRKRGKKAVKRRK